MRNKESPIPPPPPVPDENWHGRLLRAGSSRIRNEKDPHPDFIADARKSGAPRATGATCRSGERGVGSTSTTSNLWLRSHRKASCRPPPPCRPNRCSCSSRWRAISQPWGNESSSSRLASTSSRPASNKSPAKMPNLPRARLPSRTCGPRHQRLRHGRLPLRRASRWRRSRRRKPQRSPRSKKRSCHRRPGRRCPCARASSTMHGER